jgi:NAD(P)-dependent dehydrogenase (short-subunit alcohol dehydrogenase family)
MVQTGTLDGQAALVTGGTRGIGAAIADGLAAAGARVAVSGRDIDRGTSVAARIGGVFVPADLGHSARASHDLATAATDALDGRVDILVNNAGVYPSATTLTLTEDDFDAITAVNIKAPLFLVQALAPAMAARGHGVIINLGSWISTVGLPVGAAYAASKAAIEQLTRNWAAEFGPQGVRVNAIAPGITRTEGTAGVTEMLEAWAAGFPAGRIATPDDVAAAAVHLASPAAAYMHGATLVVDGGASTTRTISSRGPG